MRYRNLSITLVVLLVLALLVSLGLICAWGYTYFYGKESAAAPQTAPRAGRDSLQKLYASTIDHLDTPADSAWNRAEDSLRPDAQLAEFHRLKSDISVLLKKNSSADLDSARQKIALLQQRIEDLRSRTRLVESENRRLTEILNRLSSRLKTAAPTRISTVARTAAPNAAASATEPALFVASDLHLSVNNGDEGKEMAGSFTVRMPAGMTGAEDVFVVVLQPDGRLLQSSAWETGAFETREGRRIYSARIRFDYNRGETKKLSFTLHPEDWQKGSYILQLYHHGILIGRSAQQLL